MAGMKNYSNSRNINWNFCCIWTVWQAALMALRGRKKWQQKLHRWLDDFSILILLWKFVNFASNERSSVEGWKLGNFITHRLQLSTFARCLLTWLFFHLLSLYYTSTRVDVIDSRANNTKIKSFSDLSLLARSSGELIKIAFKNFDVK